MATSELVSRYVKEEWRTALMNEDCLMVLKLVGRYPELVNTFWKGRTALHVGARRGCLTLVETVMQQFDREERMSWTDEQFREMLLDRTIDFGSLLPESFLLAKDCEYQLDALAMAIINGNQKIIHTLVKGSILLCTSNPLSVRRPKGEGQEETVIAARSDEPGALLRETAFHVLENLSSTISRPSDPLIWQVSAVLSDVTREMSACKATEMEALKRIYDKNLDFNFLPWEIYLFHFTFVSKAMDLSAAVMKQIRFEILRRTISTPLLRFICEIQDGQGRTALHVAVDEGTVMHFLALLKFVPDISDRNQLVNSLDGVGRTPLHRAAALKNSISLQHLLGNGEVNVNEPLLLWEYASSLVSDTCIDLRGWSKRNGFHGFGIFDFHDICTALHIAIIHKRTKNVEILLEDKFRSIRQGEHALDLNTPFSRLFELQLEPTEWTRLNLGALQLAAHVGDASIFQLLLKESLALDEGKPHGQELMNSHWNPWPAIHIIAGAGNCDLLSIIMGSQHYDSSVVDFYGNSALHHAARGMDVIFDTNLIDHISCEIARDSRKDKPYKAPSLEQLAHRALVKRQRCVEILLEAGFDIWTTNDAKQCPYPGPEAPGEFLAWWFNKLTRETSASQKMYNSAANAISVTGILVATASYVGPFQPPLGYVDNRMHVSGFLTMYVVSETLAFYLAVGSVMVALMTSLPVPHESMVDEVRRTKKRVTVAVGLLFPSIICLLLDFGSASIVVIGSKKSQRLAMATASVGGLICLIVSFLFLIRLLRLIFYRDPRIRRLFRSINF